MAEKRPVDNFQTEDRSSSGVHYARRSSTQTAKKRLGVAISAASLLLVAACGQSQASKGPVGEGATDDRAPSTTSSGTAAETTSTTQERGPVPLNPNLCVVIPPEVTAAVLKVSVDSSELQTGLESCVGSDASQSAEGLLASSKLMTSGSTGVYTSIYAEPQVPKLEQSYSEHGVDMPDAQPLTVNGEDGTYIADMGLAEVPFKNGDQEVYLSVNAGLGVPVSELQQYMADVEAAIFNPQPTANK